MVAELNRAQLASGMAEKLKQHKERARCVCVCVYFLLCPCFAETIFFFREKLLCRLD